MGNQTVVITSRATGLGYAIAEGFLNIGANITLNARTLISQVEVNLDKQE